MKYSRQYSQVLSSYKNELTIQLSLILFVFVLITSIVSFLICKIKMSDKNKLHYYFKKNSISSHKTPDIPIVTDQDADTIDTDKLIEINESDNTSSSSTSLSQSSTSCSGYEIHDNENFNDKENASTTITTTAATPATVITTTNDLLTKSSSISSFKRDPATGPEQARRFILLGPY